MLAEYCLFRCQELAATSQTKVVLSGKVRLVPEQGESIILQKGDWLGDVLELSGGWKARASSKDVTVLHWDAKLWQTLPAPEILGKS